MLALKGDTPTRYARVLMGYLFTEEEMARSRYVSQRSAKPSLDPERRKLLEGTILHIHVLCVAQEEEYSKGHIWDAINSSMVPSIHINLSIWYLMIG